MGLNPSYATVLENRAVKPYTTTVQQAFVTVDILQQRFFWCEFQNKWQVKGKLKICIIKNISRVEITDLHKFDEQITNEISIIKFYKIIPEQVHRYVLTV